MKREMICAFTASMVLAQCVGCGSIRLASYGVAVEVRGWIEDVKNSKQQRRYASAFAKKMKTRQAMISLHDDVTFPIGKTTSGHLKRWVSLFSDGSFVALNSYSESGLFRGRQHRVTFCSGRWSRATGTMVALQHQDGTNWVDYAFLDLSSVTNFPSNPVQPPFLGIPRNEEHWNMLLEEANIYGPTSTP